jgi:transposase InsO family protein
MFADVFDEKEADVLPEHRKYDISIDLQEGSTPPFGPIYNLTQTEMAALKDYLEDSIAKGFIVPSKSSCGAPILFVKKKDGSLRLCVDYRGLNKITLKNRYPLPLFDELVSHMQGSQVFTKIDLKGAYNLVRIKPGDEWKSAFRTRYGLFEYRVMPFGLANAPATFQHLMNDVFRDILDVYVTVYLDDILIFSKNVKEHEQHVKEVLRRLQENKLYGSLKKCEFEKDKVEFLGYLISKDGLEMDSAKVEAVRNWPVPKNVNDIQVFLGFANFYRRFIPHFSNVALPMTRMTRKDTPFLWDDTAESAFNKLKLLFTKSPILHHAKSELQFIMECDASDSALGAILSQKNVDGSINPIAYHSRKFTKEEVNYEIHDKELLAIVDGFKEWRHYLAGAKEKVIVLCDHRNLLYFMTTKMLNRRQARWAMNLADFDFAITYVKGTENGKADALSRRVDYSITPVEKHSSQFQTLLPSSRFSGPIDVFMDKTSMMELLTLEIDEIDNSETILEMIKKSYISHLPTKKMLDTELFSTDYCLTNGILYRKGLIYVPDLVPIKLLILRECHDSKSAGHFGVRKTMDLIKRSYWWSKMLPFVEDYVASCDICCRTKVARHKPHGLLLPLPVPSRPYSWVSLDFIVKLPKSIDFNGVVYDSILNIVDLFTKKARFIPVSETITSEMTAKIFTQEIFREHGCPDVIISDRGPQFAAKFWKEYHRLMGSEVRLSTAFHPQTDGQTERVNQVLEQYLRCFIDYQQDDWVALLPFAEFAYNNSYHVSIKQSPFHANYGYHPSFDSTPSGSSSSPGVPSGSSTHLGIIPSSTSPPLANIPPSGLSSSTLVPAAEKLVVRIHEVQEQLKLDLTKAKETQKRFADDKRTDAGTEFVIGDKVWLSRENLKTQRPSIKLDYRKFGPFEVLEKIGTLAYRLKLPKEFKIHDVFHVSLLELCKQNNLPDRIVPPPPAVIIENQREFEIDEILDSKISNRKLCYLVSWVGYNACDNMWLDVSELDHAQELVSEFHAKYPLKPSKSISKRGGNVRVKDGPGAY